MHKMIKNIREEYLEFGKCIQVNGEAILKKIIRILKETGLEIQKFLKILQKAGSHALLQNKQIAKALKKVLS